METNHTLEANNIFKPGIKKIFHKNWVALGFFIVFHLGLIFIERTIALASIWILTLLLLTTSGKQLIYLAKPKNQFWYIAAPILGFLMLSISALLCWGMLGWQDNNIFVDMAKAVEAGYHMPGENAVLPARIAILLFAWLIGPFLEELLFRGYIQAFAENLSGIWVAIFVQAALFAIIHPLNSLSWPITIFAAGILFGWIRLKSCSIWPAVLAHAAYNIGILLLSFIFLPHLIY